MKIIIIVLCISMFSASSLYAATINVDCPKIKVDNPYTILSYLPADWQVDPDLAASYLNCRSHINPQGYLKCSYKASGHSTVNTYAVRRMPPDNTTCEAKDPVCGFTCTTTPKKYSPQTKAPVRRLRK